MKRSNVIPADSFQENHVFQDERGQFFKPLTGKHRNQVLEVFGEPWSAPLLDGSEGAGGRFRTG
jgi:hypothetical protein